jgi:hypothetical protein
MTFRAAAGFCQHARMQQQLIISGSVPAPSPQE